MDASTDVMKTIAAEYDAARRRVVAENGDLSERILAAGAVLYYDPEDDWFLLSIGEPGEAVTLEIDDVLSLRLDPATWKVVGVEIPDVSAFTAQRPDVAKDILTLVRLAAARPGAYVSVAALQMGQVAAELRELLPV